MASITSFNENFDNLLQELLLAESLFSVFDTDNSGTLNFYEYMHVKQAMGFTTPEQKLGWIFSAFDQDHGGNIDVLEIKNVVAGLFKMAGLEVDKEKIVGCVAEIRFALDQDRDWKISKDEFVANGLKSRFISSLLAGFTPQIFKVL